MYSQSTYTAFLFIKKTIIQLFQGAVGVEEYIIKNNKKLRYGYTTGSCAAAAVRAAAEMLLRNMTIRDVTITTPKGKTLNLAVHDIFRDDNSASCCVYKDSGDDPDVTNGIAVYAKVVKNDTNKQYRIDGGIGVGRVTKSGLSCEVGEAAINPVPRRMILEQVKEVAEMYNYNGGFDIIISIPEGVDIAKRTFNPRLGIVGGISVLGTTGIVEPMSEQALIDSIKTEMNVLRAQGYNYLIVSPGNYGNHFTKMNLKIDLDNSIKCSNFIGETLDHALTCQFKGLLFIGHIGKFVKLSGGIMNTHSRYADCRMELISAHTALVGASQEQIRSLMESVTTDDAVDILNVIGLKESVMQSLIDKIQFYLNNRTYDEIRIETIMFSNKHGILAKTQGADELLQIIQSEEIK